MSWLAGHPQTSWFLTYVAVAYLAYRCFGLRAGWRPFLGSMVLLTVVTIGVTAVTLFPGIEYLLLTSREELGFAAKGNGFPFRDIAQFVLPRLGEPMVAAICRPTRTLLRRCRRRSQPARGPFLVDFGGHWLTAQLGRK